MHRARLKKTKNYITETYFWRTKIAENYVLFTSQGLVIFS
jgi:hypothetical protein